MTLDKGEREHHPPVGGIPASQLPESDVLPRPVMESAARLLPANLAWFAGNELVLAEKTAAAYQRVIDTDFSSTAWHMDCELDAETVVIWLGLGGSFIADFSASSEQARIFAWIMSPDRMAAQHTLKNLKGRDGRWVPTSLLTRPETFLSWLDCEREPVNQDAVRSILELGPVGFRFAVRPEALPSYFVLRGAGGGSAQVVLPGMSPVWSDWLNRLQKQTGHAFAGITSANFSDLGREVVCGGTHKDLAELQADMGYLGVPILSGPLCVDGEDIPFDQRAAGYKRANAPYADMNPTDWEAHSDVLPISLSLLSFTPDAERWELVRHGSLHAERLKNQLRPFGVSLDVCTEERLRMSNYVGDLVAAFPCFSGLGPRLVAEISQLVETRSFDADEMIFDAGDLADKTYFIAEGVLAARLETDVRMEAGAFFGEIGVVREKRRTAAVVGIEPGQLLILSTHILHRLMEDHPKLAQTIHDAVDRRENRFR